MVIKQNDCINRKNNNEDILRFNLNEIITKTTIIYHYSAGSLCTVVTYL